MHYKNLCTIKRKDPRGADWAQVQWLTLIIRIIGVLFNYAPEKGLNICKENEEFKYVKNQSFSYFARV